MGVVSPDAKHRVVAPTLNFLARVRLSLAAALAASLYRDEAIWSNGLLKNWGILMASWISVALVAGLLAGQPASASAPRAIAPPPLPIPVIPFSKVVLSNGLTLIVHEDHKAPVVAVNLWYHVGSKNEPPGRRGFAHLFEHLMFGSTGGTQRGWFEKLESIGASDINGTTNEDRTNFFETVPTPGLDTALAMEAERMGHLLDNFSILTPQHPTWRGAE